jgi:hypothetical protein
LRDYFSTLPEQEQAALEEAWAAAESGRPEVHVDPERKAELWAILERTASAPGPEALRRPARFAAVPPRYLWLALAALVALLGSLLFFRS